MKEMNGSMNKKFLTYEQKRNERVHTHLYEQNQLFILSYERFLFIHIVHMNSERAYEQYRMNNHRINKLAYERLYEQN